MNISKGKIIANLVITLPASIIANVIFYIGLKFEIKVFNIELSNKYSICSCISCIRHNN